MLLGVQHVAVISPKSRCWEKDEWQTVAMATQDTTLPPGDAHFLSHGDWPTADILSFWTGVEL